MKGGGEEEAKECVPKDCAMASVGLFGLVGPRRTRQPCPGAGHPALRFGTQS